MKLLTLQYATGHELRDNSCGDYGLECPSNGYVGFAHPAQVRFFERGGACWACGERVGARTNPEVQPYDRDEGARA